MTSLVTVQPACGRCFDTAFWHLPYDGEGYPMAFCDCEAALEFLVANPWAATGETYHGEPYELGQPIPEAFADHEPEVVWYRDTGPFVWIDKGFLDDVRLLWSHGIDTRYCCEGGRFPGDRYVALTCPEDVDRALPLLPWGFASEKDRNLHMAIYDRPGGHQ